MKLILFILIGTGKSQLLRYASNLSSRSVFTNGIGSTAAGLTVSCIKEAGEWMFEVHTLYPQKSPHKK